MFLWFRELILVLILVSNSTQSGPGMDPNGSDT